MRVSVLWCARVCVCAHTLRYCQQVLNETVRTSRLTPVAAQLQEVEGRVDQNIIPKEVGGHRTSSGRSKVSLPPLEFRCQFLVPLSSRTMFFLYSDTGYLCPGSGPARPAHLERSLQVRL